MDIEILKRIEKFNELSKMVGPTKSRKKYILYEAIVDIINIYTLYKPNYPFCTYFFNPKSADQNFHLIPGGDYEKTILDPNLKKFLFNNDIYDMRSFCKLIESVKMSSFPLLFHSKITYKQALLEGAIRFNSYDIYRLNQGAIEIQKTVQGHAGIAGNEVADRLSRKMFN